MTYFISKVGSIQVILDSLDMKTDENDDQKSGESHPVSVQRSTKSKRSSKKFFSKEFVKHLIPDNVNEVEFIYRVNFEAGKGQTHTYTFALTFEPKLFIHCTKIQSSH